MGTALILAISAACSSCTDTVGVVVTQEAVVIEVSPTDVSLSVGTARKVTGVVKDAAGAPVDGAVVVWSSSNKDIATVDAAGNITAVKPGTAHVIAATSSGVSNGVTVTVQDVAPPPAVASDGEFVVFPSEEIAFIIGPQLRSGSSANPWPWFDSNAIEMGLYHGGRFLENLEERMYYDQALAQYINYFRTGDVQFLDIAREIADTLYLKRQGSGTGTAPRSVALGGIMLRALDGRPEYWGWIQEWTNHHIWNWGERRATRETLHYGVRDGGYALLYATYLAAVHPDGAVRDEYRQRSLHVARDYYVRLQFDDGSWRWDESSWPEQRMQPFMVGLLLEGLSAVHKLTGDPQVAAAITSSAENLWAVAYRGAQVVEQRPEYTWRGMWYTVYGTDGPTGTTSLRGGSDRNSIREVRQLNATVVHAFGYAYRVSGDPRFLQWGDEVFAATFGKGQGPLSDELSGLADFRAKEYNQSYRSAGRYLAYRAGAR